jgi:two-component system cell cycle sensor histidine kinase/response regulator CckA
MKDKPKILLIDDSKETVAGLTSFLEDKYDVVSAHNGLDGYKEFEAQGKALDLIITDLVMPEISGVGLIEMIKKQSPEIPIIAITGWGHHPKALATDAKADLVLDKPFGMHKLRQAIKTLLEGKK